ncbi:MAG: MmcQ/YjbR family DNA-binding protein [Dichotomicrobium sp.]
MKPERQGDWERVKEVALGLGLPGVEETTSYGQPALKTHGKLWVWWSPHEDALVFKVPIEERDILVEAEPDTFFVTAHYKGSPLVLMRPDRLDLEWVRVNLIRVWRAQAPKRVLKACDGQQDGAE